MEYIKSFDNFTSNSINEWDSPDFTWESLNHKNLKFRLMCIMNYFYKTSFFAIYREGNRLEKVITFKNDVESLSNLPMFKECTYSYLVAYARTNRKLDVKFVFPDGGEKTVPFDKFDEDTQKLIYDELVTYWRNSTKEIFKLSDEL